ncbi:GNAT family N-acetyltransferase [Paenibacillus sp. SC116]|uniref:GNAT family N-acetyltransferase n=1 Tax=Paenibacillus sp. SC116 TaxID=2968986 RepID=UPI00215B3EFA|nr:GNAT family N-acetyltransferase [Paenibacillus sp. SC116]MCR8842643.1 GNAT family N-acetyltransferase [Paenibacillus sp. SC116]
MLYFPKLETKRLILRELTLADGDGVFKHFSDAEITRFMDIEPCKDIKEAEEIIQFHIDDTGCRYGLFSKANGEFIGTCGFHCWVQGTESKAEIGFDLSTRFWGQGYMQEALVKLIKVGFDVMRLDFIEATVEVGNVRSQKLLGKMNFVKHEELKDGLGYYTLKQGRERNM